MSNVKLDIEKIFHAHPFARYLLEMLETNGHEAVFVGGIVRDAVREHLHEEIDLDPIEVDIATSAPPQEIKKIFSNYKVLEVGEAFGVLVVRSPDGDDYEVATYRTEMDYDGRKPGRVEHVHDLKHDVQRRDFTMNGLAVGLDGRVIDHVGGIEDLKQHLVRAIGDPELRFREDHLRMLRAVRFTASLGAKLDPQVQRAIQNHAPDLIKISGERIRDEIIQIFETKRSHIALAMMSQLGLLDVVFPEVERCKGVEQPLEYHPEGDVYTHTMLAMQLADRAIFDPRVKLAVLLHDIGKRDALRVNDGVNAAGHDAIGAKMAREICRRLRFSNEDVEFIVSLIAEHQRIGHFPSMNRAKQVRFLKRYESAEFDFSAFNQRYYWMKSLLQLMIVDCQASGMKSQGWLEVLKSIRPLLLHVEDLEKRIQAHNLIDGNDIIALGVPKGPEIGKILDAVYEMIYSGDITSRKDALQAAKSMLKS